MGFETFVALRYLRGKRKNRFISLIAIISVAGVSVGVIALIIVLGVMTGFNIALRETIIGNRAHLNIIDAYGYSLPNYEQAIDEIESVVAAQKEIPKIVASAPFIQVQALIENKSGSKRETVTTGVYLTGIDPALEPGVTDLAKNLTTEDGRWFGRGAMPGKKQVVLGYNLAGTLGVGVGDRVGVLTLKNKVSPYGLKRGQ